MPPPGTGVHCGHMDSTPPSQPILDTLRTVEFRLGLKGYNVDEVDEYLEKAAVEAESVLEQLRTANERLRQANERIGQLEVEAQRAAGERSSPLEPAPATGITDDTLQRTLVLAQKFVDQTKREAEAEAAEIVSRADERATAVVQQAEDQARQITTESEQRLRDEVARLESMRTRLAGDVEAMTRHLDEQRTRIRASLTEALKWIDERVQPGSVLTSVRDAADKTNGGSGGSGGSGRSEAPRQHAPERKQSGGDGGPSSPGGSVGSSERAGSQEPRLRSVGSGEDLFESRRSE
jgi:DivIVA domain-containing protein